jgi:hypothetical protein
VPSARNGHVSEEMAAFLEAGDAVLLNLNLLPALDTGSYYVRAFRAEGTVPDHLAPLCRDGVVRLCCKPPADPRGVE